jgi:hypothetical protein
MNDGAAEGGSMQPQISAEYDNSAGADPEITFRNVGPADLAEVAVTTDRSRTYETVLTAFAGHGQTVVCEISIPEVRDVFSFL